ncbi:Ras domain-containing protein [Rhizoctonia solani]|uniref:Ras domain-containing protein n=1 Tax=Rhizoctonia solani TaxID=456999 RepID=A0A8H8SX73_9AGAM|nr:Ras domain-containing protein [Rhizoctonia solani]QRW21821.1 Ras domain-containing protein [Rhizoctonia solani]
MDSRATTTSLPDVENTTVVIVGDSGVGKSSLAKRYVRFGAHGCFPRWFTITVNYIHISSVRVAIVVYDITNRASFMSSGRWINIVRKEGGPDVVILLVGNKEEQSDRRAFSTSRQVKKQEASRLAAEVNAIFFETSAKTGHNVGGLLKTIAKCSSRNPGERFTLIRDQFQPALDQYIQACLEAQVGLSDEVRLNNAPQHLATLNRISSDITTHIQRLQVARSTVYQNSNSISSITPINTLPSGRGCDGNLSEAKYPPYPDVLSHVSSFWRRVAIDTPCLWTHIDIALGYPLNRGLFSRAKVYADRAGPLPLEIHIIDKKESRESQNHSYRDRNNEFEFLDSASVPIKVLELDLYMHTNDSHGEIYYSILEYLFARCIPGALTHYIVNMLLAIPSAQLKKLWLPISIIRLSALCPHWESIAYHGLVELHIDQGIPKISESQLVSILRSSPKLQVFHLKNSIQLQGSVGDTNIERVLLEDLRDINIATWGEEDVYSVEILRRIVPGKAPLQLAYLGESNNALVDFCSRANVVCFYTRFWESKPLLPLLNQVLHLSTLVLDGALSTGTISSLFGLGNIHDNQNNQDNAASHNLKNILPSTTQVNTLYLLGYQTFNFEEIEAVVKLYSVQRLMIYGGKLSYQTDDGRLVSRNLRNTRVKLSSINACPIIEYHPDSEAIERDGDDWIIASLS